MTKYTEVETRNRIKAVFRRVFPDGEFRFINFAGSKHMESGLSDLMVLVYSGLSPVKRLNFWFEIKAHWRDWSKQSRLQEWNIKHNRKFGFYTGWAVGSSIKKEWDGEEIPLDAFISMCLENELKKIEIIKRMK